MRLIDADARVTVQSFDAMNEEYNHDEMTVEQALDFATDEGCPPTIDAIPVEATAKRLQRAFFSDSWEAWAEWLRRNYSDEDFAAHVDRKKDAIPVEWLREKIDGYASRLRSRELDALVTVLAMWQKEQEAK